MLELLMPSPFSQIVIRVVVLVPVLALLSAFVLTAEPVLTAAGLYPPPTFVAWGVGIPAEILGLLLWKKGADVNDWLFRYLARRPVQTVPIRVVEVTSKGTHHWYKMHCEMGQRQFSLWVLDYPRRLKEILNVTNHPEAVCGPL